MSRAFHDNTGKFPETFWASPFSSGAVELQHPPRTTKVARKMASVVVRMIVLLSVMSCGNRGCFCHSISWTDSICKCVGKNNRLTLVSHQVPGIERMVLFQKIFGTKAGDVLCASAP